MAHPRMYDDRNPALARLRKVCLALPDAFEKEAWGECTFRVTGGSMFAMTDNHHHGSDHIAVWIKGPADVQQILVGADPKRFFVPPYMGAKGWIGVRLDYKVDWDELTELLKDGYSMSVPKRRRAPANSAGTKISSGAPRKQPRRAATARAVSTTGAKSRSGKVERSSRQRSSRR